MLVACSSKGPDLAARPDSEQPVAAEAPAGPSGDVTSDDPSAAPPAPIGPDRLIEHVPHAMADELSFKAIEQSASVASALDSAGIRDKYVPRFRSRLSYDPNAAEFMDRIQASALALSDGERSALGQNGFVISARREFPTFLRGLVEIYSQHLPLYVTADALLDSMHSSYQIILDLFERRLIIPELGTLLSGMLSRLPAANASAESVADMDLYLSVALGLLKGETPAPSATAAAAEIERLLASALAASGTETINLFGVERDEDFSQFKPRGHYTATPALQGYFRALVWLARVDFRLLETQSNGSVVFRRDQYASMLLMHELVGPDLTHFEHIDAIVRAFVGESDNMVLSEVAKLVADLGGPAAAQSASDEAVVAAIIAGGYGKQQVASSLITNPGLPETLPLNRSFALLGQRYVVDAHVFSEVVHDRIPDRLMPSTMDAAFAALGNGQALLYEGDLERYPQLPGALARMHVLVDAHDDSFWQANLYNLWLRAIRQLSPAQDLTDPRALGRPELTGSEAWGRRILSTQLAAWSQLRHDTQSYAKQSYSAGALCDYPDAYVDPYPAVYEALHTYALSGLRLVELLDDAQSSLFTVVQNYFQGLERVTSLLGDMANRELRGEPFSEEQLAFINEAVEIQQGGCSVNGVPSGWYARLFVLQDAALKFDPVIVDVHTQPTDEVGNPVGNILHVGTGYPRLMVTTVDTCMGPRAYAGVVYAYHERTTKDFERLDDQQWAQGFQLPTRPADVPWMNAVLAR
jgi:hypothetical protein